MSDSEQGIPPMTERENKAKLEGAKRRLSKCSEDLARARKRIDELESELGYIRREANQQKAKANPDPDRIWLMAHNAIEKSISPPPRAELETEVERLREALEQIAEPMAGSADRKTWRGLAQLRGEIAANALDAAEDGSNE